MSARVPELPARRSPTLGFFALHLLLAVLWMALTGWSGRQFLAGLFIGLAAMAVSSRVVGADYLRSSAAVAQLAAVFLAHLIRANLELARDILRRAPRFSPSILAFDTSSLGPVNTFLLVTLVSLTPGSLCIDLDRSGRTVFIHTLYAHDEEEARRDVRRYAELLQAIAGTGPRRREEGRG